GLATPVEITDPKTLSKFQVWTGPGTSSNESESFIVNWSPGPVAERPSGLERYEVRVYVKCPKECLMYVVFYEYNPSIDQGYIYLPGKADECTGSTWGRFSVGSKDPGSARRDCGRISPGRLLPKQGRHTRPGYPNLFQSGLAVWV